MLYININRNITFYIKFSCNPSKNYIILYFNFSIFASTSSISKPITNNFMYIASQIGYNSRQYVVQCQDTRSRIKPYIKQRQNIDRNVFVHFTSSVAEYVILLIYFYILPISAILAAHRNL